MRTRRLVFASQDQLADACAGLLAMGQGWARTPRKAYLVDVSCFHQNPLLTPDFAQSDIITLSYLVEFGGLTGQF